MPPITTVPNMRRAIAPEPVAMANGTVPRMKANEVIRIGRRRVRAATKAASITGLPFSTSIRANSTIRMAFLAARPMSITSPICAYTLLTMCLDHSAANAPNPDRLRPSGEVMGINLEKELQTQSAQLVAKLPVEPVGVVAQHRRSHHAIGQRFLN